MAAEYDWEKFLQELRKSGIGPDEIITGIKEVVDVEQKKIGEMHSLSDRIHELQYAAMHLAFHEGIAEEIMDWSVEMLELLQERTALDLHFVLESEASVKSGKKWVAKHHDIVLAAIEIEKLSEGHFLRRVKAKLQELIEVYDSIKGDLEVSDKQRIEPLISAVVHGLERAMEV